jgi:steroid delta-isomerase-like uncharacterized protein
MIVAQDPRTVVRRVIDEVWNARNAAAADELIADNVVWHHSTLGERRGRAAFFDTVQEMRSAFPDTKIAVDALAADGDKVLMRWVATGTHQGPYRGATPSGESVTWSGMVLDRIADGRIVERWTYADARPPGSPHDLATR